MILHNFGDNFSNKAALFSLSAYIILNVLTFWHPYCFYSNNKDNNSTVSTDWVKFDIYYNVWSKIFQIDFIFILYPLTQFQMFWHYDNRIVFILIMVQHQQQWQHSNFVHWLSELQNKLHYFIMCVTLCSKSFYFQYALT